ncbi:hypothetical protein [Chitinophaga agrisoli]|uniref:hypothetical protein n=1 Tax=Chitinophaga agrisoli TaxID=2607653 RepID=UPI001661E118|nr:hypothetical protein [Chitinophaga agrisoli]
MIAVFQIIQRFLAGKPITPVVSEVQTALEPVREENATQGVEFLDDIIMEEDQPEEETK